MEGDGAGSAMQGNREAAQWKAQGSGTWWMLTILSRRLRLFDAIKELVERERRSRKDAGYVDAAMDGDDGWWFWRWKECGHSVLNVKCWMRWRWIAGHFAASRPSLSAKCLQSHLRYPLSP